MRSIDSGRDWKVISPDLTLRPGEKEEGAQGVIYTIAPSPVLAGTIWVGTDNGLVQLTRNEGLTWSEVTPPGLLPWSMMSLIDASPHDAASAFAAIDRHQMDDIAPHIYRTHDFGKTSTKISTAIPRMLMCMRCVKILFAKAFCSQALSWVFTFRSTMVSYGNPCNKIFR